MEKFLRSFQPVGPHEEVDADFQPLPRASDVECFLSQLIWLLHPWKSSQQMSFHAIPQCLDSFTLAIPPMTSTTQRLSFPNSAPRSDSWGSNPSHFFQSPSRCSSPHRHHHLQPLANKGPMHWCWMGTLLCQKLVIERPTMCGKKGSQTQMDSYSLQHFSPVVHILHKPWFLGLIYSFWGPWWGVFWGTMVTGSIKHLNNKSCKGSQIWNLISEALAIKSSESCGVASARAGNLQLRPSQL